MFLNFLQNRVPFPASKPSEFPLATLVELKKWLKKINESSGDVREENTGAARG